MKVLRFVAGLLLSALSVPANAVDELRVVDLTGEFDRFAMSTAEMPDADRVIAFEKQIGPIANGFYERDRRPEGYDFRILTQLKTYPGRRSETLAISRKFNRLFTPARHRFEAAFGPLTSRQPAYLIDSMGELDGGTRELNGKYTMLFGADVIAEFHAGKNLDAFFYHEMFHLYHEPALAKCMTLWCSLWAEGLATYVSSRLDPGATDEELVLNLPKPIRPAVEANRKRAVCAVALRLDSTAYDDFSALFQGDDNLPGLPSRMGYYIGFLVARDIGRTHDLQQMAKMSLSEAKPLIDASLARMATCGQSTTEARERSRTSRTGG
ncbi:hypothetical protein LZ496_00300 [Sphingomonas sp. NSE70-1]|uniref:DUF2268 domain-containing protein n=1 Tax=Sphingomonas caseinilyticus TaxID=2908205 RepID=A0ABT0RQE3_9SPHN|nr:hypothetical protein [Sphingomonas caseinilyticus]MCL6697232.1 hypothetical protein [Sphingomonas caseinilyticus]